VGLIEYCDSTQYTCPKLALVKVPYYNDSDTPEERVDCIREKEFALLHSLGHSGSVKYLTAEPYTRLMLSKHA
jgi:hypothetical protein